MALTEGREVPEKERQTNPIYPNSVSCFVLLASQERTLQEANQLLQELKDKGYNIRGHRMRPDIDYPAGRSEALDTFFNRAINSGFALETPKIHFTEKGIEMLETMVLRCFVQDSELTQRFAADTGVNLNSILQKYILEYQDIKERLSRWKYS